jgi:hypothetical protein
VVSWKSIVAADAFDAGAMAGGRADARKMVPEGHHFSRSRVTV